MEEERDEFALPPTKANPLGNVKIGIAHGAGQVSDPALRSTTEHNERLLMFLGDLPAGLAREERAAQEKCWTVEKRFLAEYYLAPPSVATTTASDGFMVTATNGTACYAFRGPQESLYGYYRACALLEQQSAAAAWNWRIDNAQLKSEASTLRSHILSVGQKDAQLAVVGEACVKRLETIIDSLPEARSDLTPKVPAPRPGPDDPEVILQRSPMAPVAAPPVAGDEWHVWSCNVLNPKNHWTASHNATTVRAQHGTIPCMAVSKTHMALLWQQNGGSFQLRLLSLTDFGRPSPKALGQWTLALGTSLSEHFVDDGQGMLTLSLSDDGVCCVAAGGNETWCAQGYDLSIDARGWVRIASLQFGGGGSVSECKLSWLQQ